VVAGHLSSLVMKQDDEIVAKRAQLELVESYVAQIRVPVELKRRLAIFFRRRLDSSLLSSVPPASVYHELPMALQIDVASHTNGAVVKASPLLRNCSSSFIDRLYSLLRERTIESGTVIFRTAEACRELLFVASGSVEIYEDAESCLASSRSRASALLATRSAMSRSCLSACTCRTRKARSMLRPSCSS
jgi:hypothetical protein